MYEKILVPTDGSDAAAAAGEAAVALARRFGSTVHVLHVVELGELPTGVESDELIGLGDEATATIAGVADEAGVTATTEVVESADPVHRAIVDYAVDRDVDCIAMGTHGRTGLDRVVLGSVAERTLRTSPVPVMTASADAVFDPDFESVLVPTDGSAGATTAVDHAVELATATEASLHVVHVVDQSGVWGDVDAAAIFEALEEAGQRAVDEAVARAKEADLSVEASMLAGLPAHAIVDYAAEREVDCIVLGTHGRTGVGRLLLGSVTERVVRLAGVPVVAVKAPEVAEGLLSE